MFEDFLPEVSLVNVHVNLGCANIFMSEHRLDGPQVGSALQKLCGEAMAEGVGADVLADACLLGILFDIDEERYAAQVFAAAERDEDKVVLARLHLDALPHDEPFP